jgi:hypothetical protein
MDSTNHTKQVRRVSQSCKPFETIVLTMLKPFQRGQNPQWLRMVWEWPQIVSREKAALWEPVKIQKKVNRQGRHQTLMIHCYGISAFESQFQKSILKQLINQYMGFSFIQDIQFRDYSASLRTIESALYSNGHNLIVVQACLTLEEALVQLENSRQQYRNKSNI